MRTNFALISSIKGSKTISEIASTTIAPYPCFDLLNLGFQPRQGLFPVPARPAIHDVL